MWCTQAGSNYLHKYCFEAHVVNWSAVTECQGYCVFQREGLPFVINEDTINMHSCLVWTWIQDSVLAQIMFMLQFEYEMCIIRCIPASGSNARILIRWKAVTRFLWNVHVSFGSVESHCALFIVNNKFKMLVGYVLQIVVLFEDRPAFKLRR